MRLLPALLSLAVVAGGACGSASAGPSAASTTTTSVTGIIHYVPKECGMTRAELDELKAAAASRGYDALTTELERQIAALANC